VSDRSLSTELLVLVLAASFVWPCSGYCPTYRPSDSVRGRAEGRPGEQAGARATALVFQPLAGRHGSKLRGVIDQVPVFDDDVDAEDWLEGPTAFAPHYAVLLFPAWFGVAPRSVGMPASSGRGLARTIHFLCSYQC
jgi:hypothetical protein